MSFLRSNYSTLSGPATPLAVVHAFDSVGSGLFTTSAAVYFVVVTGLPATQVGLGLSLAGMTGFVASVVMGKAADRAGARRLLFLSMLTLAGAYCLYPLTHSPLVFFAVLALIGALEWGSGPLLHTLIMEVVPDSERVSTRAALRSVFNLGFSVGALLAAALIGIGGLALQFLPLGNALSFLLAAAAVLRVPPSPMKQERTPAGSRFRALTDMPFLRVIAASTLLALNGTVLSVGIPLWIVTGHRLPNSTIPLIFTLNTILVVLFQVKAAQSSNTLDGAVAAARRSGLVSAAACLVLSAGAFTDVWVTGCIALMAVLLITLGELWQSSGAFAIGFALAPDSARGEYLGAFHLRMVIQATAGPAVIAVLVTGKSIWATVGWIAVACVLVLGSITIGPAVYRARRDDVAAAPA